MNVHDSRSLSSKRSLPHHSMISLSQTGLLERWWKALTGLICLAFGLDSSGTCVHLNILHRKPYHLLSFIYSDPHINFSIAAGAAGRTSH